MTPAARALAWAALLASAVAWADEPAFDISQYEKKPFEIGGYAEIKHEGFALNKDGALYQLSNLGAAGRSTLDRSTGTVQLAGKLRSGIATIDFRTNSAWQHDALASQTDNTLYEGALSLRLSEHTTLEAGKRALRWGKGYAWNPIGFVERSKDPNDPNLAREGFWMVDGDFIFNPGGVVQTIAFTPVLVPVTPRMNRDFGAQDHLNPAAKLYVLIHDIDVDLAWQGAGSRPARLGADFSMNVASNVEVHGEWARAGTTSIAVVDAAGHVSTKVARPQSWLLGLRYLTEGDTTYIAEYYRNGAGYTPAQLQAFDSAADAAYAQVQQGGALALLQKAQALAQGSYGRPNPGTDYLYLRAQQKDALGIVYFQPALTAMVNLRDRSWQLTPELLYTGIRNVELRARAYLLSGGNGTDFGEKQVRRKLEFYARYYF
jgi:hypothetical protein